MRYLTEDEKKDKNPWLTEQAQRWNKFHGGVPVELRGEERREALKAYRVRLASMVRTNDAEPKAWACAILSRIADGEIVPAIAERMAKEALNVKEEE